MKISLIAAMANNRIIGKDNDMPWHLPADLKHFKKITLGKPVLMGRKTYESIGRPLPGRRNIVLSRNADLHIEGVEVVDSIDKINSLLTGVDELMVIGGGHIYNAFLAKADILYLTHIDLDVEGDTQFPDYEGVANWRVVEQQVCEPDDNNPYSYRFVKYSK